LKTLAHELGHVGLHNPGREDRTTRNCRGVVEVEAESVAYLVCAHVGVETGEYTFPYVAAWAGEAKDQDPTAVVAATGRRVLSTANSIIERIDTGNSRTRQIEPAQKVVERRHATANVAAARLLAMHATAASWYRSQLLPPLADGPRAYLEARGIGHIARPIGNDADDRWQVGYAPGSRTGLVDRLRANGFTDSELEASGLAIRTRKGSLADRFRDRIMLPIRDADGQVIAFIGRAPDERDDQTPKYLNSPNTAIYHKAGTLFGLGVQPLAGRRVILVEGPLDVLAVRAAVPGVVAVAPCGTAFTKGQAGVLLAAGVRDLVVAFDADRGGLAAAVKAWGTLRPHFGNPVLARLPDGADPAALAETSPAALARALTEDLVPLGDAVVDDRIARWRGRLDSAEGRSLAAHDLGALIATLPAADVARQVARTANTLGVLNSTMTALVADAISPGASPGRRPPGETAMDARSDISTQQVTIARAAFTNETSEEVATQWPSRKMAKTSDGLSPASVRAVERRSVVRNQATGPAVGP
jgi:DNA primase catalytic core